MKLLTTDDRAAGLSAFAEFAASVELVTVDRSAFRTAARLADQPALVLRAPDALHLAICSARGATMCTLDHQLLRAAETIGVRVERPEPANSR